MSWIDDVNDELERRRKAFQESLKSGEALNRKRSFIGKVASSFADKETRANNLREAQKKSIANMPKDAMVKRGKTRGDSNVASGHLKSISKLAGKNSGIKSKNKKLEAWKKYLSKLPNEFTSKELREVLSIDGYTDYKRILRSELVEKCYKGTHTVYDPPKYRKL